ncbi:hypothetical protein PQX77_017019 [Marasmius sp. AFHP31]|nr:hypothetical protein PQX77_017019 [Marasmius sp. AFHP31]
MFRYLFANRSGFGSTNAILVKLIRLILGTGLLTSTVTVVDVILFTVFKQENYHLVTVRMLSKLYSNSMMVLLNARLSIRNGRNYEIGGPDNLTWAVESNPNPQNQQTSTTHHPTDFARRSSTAISVPIQTREERDSMPADMAIKPGGSYSGKIATPGLS